MKISRKILMQSAIFVLSIFIIVSMAMAVVPELNLVFEVKDMGKVTFNGKIHADKGLKCIDCHPTPFPNKRSAAGTYKMEKMNKGENCGICHNGTKAFKTSDPANCTKCHKK
ncbi:MAG: cytochrome c3 family protein [Nitrospirota bacterium]